MKKILFLTAFVPNEAAAAEKNTKFMLDDLGRFYLVDLVYFKYDIDESYIPTHKMYEFFEFVKILFWSNF